MKFRFPKLKSGSTKATKKPDDDDDQVTVASTGTNSVGGGDFFAVDMKLPKDLTPLTDIKFANLWTPLSLEQSLEEMPRRDGHTFAFGSPLSLEQSLDEMPKRDGHTFAVGSSTADDDTIFFKHDTGLFQCVHEAWMNHWNLRTSPEDWWFAVSSKVAKAVADAAKDEAFTIGSRTATNPVRDFFVTHQGKETVSVEIDAQYLEEADYEAVFQQFSQSLHDKIKVPEYTSAMENDFATTSVTHKIASQVNLMSSLQEFFEYKMIFMGCGIRAVEMYGDEADWDRLGEKLADLKKILEPISNRIYLPKAWWAQVSYVFQHLALTRKDPSNPEVAQFWSQVITKTQDWERGPGVYGMGPRTHQVDAYDGWLINFLTGMSVLKVKDVAGCKALSGLNSVPVKVEMRWCSPLVSEETKVVAGVMGFQRHKGEDTSNGVPSLQPVHMWAMLLPPNSQLPRIPKD